MNNKNKIGGFVSLESIAYVIITIIIVVGTIVMYNNAHYRKVWIPKQLECKENCETTVVSTEDGKRIITDKEGKQVIVDKDNEIIEVIEPKK
jgi:hypothetical protein